MESLIVGILVSGAAYLVVRPYLKPKSGRRSESVDDCATACSSCACSCGPDAESRTPARLLAGLLVLGLAGQAPALDTTEPFEIGFSDAEYYAGFEGLGRGSAERELCNEFVVGFGIAERLSGSMSACFAGSQKRLAGETSIGFGLFANIYESGHFDADLMFGAGASGEGLGVLSFAPSFELNYDRDPDQGSWGLYLRGGFEATGQPVETLAGERLLDGILNPGIYLTLDSAHQFFVEYDAALGMGSVRDPGENEHGVGIGWNALFAPSFELITQLHRGVAQGGGESNWSLNVGFIATLATGD